MPRPPRRRRTAELNVCFGKDRPAAQGRKQPLMRDR